MTTALFSDAASLSRTTADFSWPRVTEITSYPALAKTSTMPVAMVPEPTTPTVVMPAGSASLTRGTASTTFGEPGRSYV